MNYKLNYDFIINNIDDCYDNKLETFHYDYWITENIHDIEEYLFEKQYNKKYQFNTCFLEKNSREFFQDIWYKWRENTLDVWAIYHEPNMLDFLHDKYKKVAYREFLNNRG